MTTTKKLSLSIILLFILLFGGVVFLRFKDRLIRYATLPTAQTYHASTSTPTDQPVVAAATNVALPEAVNLKIPFTSQAPKQNWDHPYQEFCEEASSLMAAGYIKGDPIKNADDADAKLLAIKDFEMKKFGFYEDTTAEETAVILREHFGIDNVVVVPDPTIESIKQALAQGKAVILPAAGRELGNPYYQQPGPLFHMLVIKGYTKDGDFITNDPGTRRGADYIYQPNVLLNANHDWNGGDVAGGRKVMIVVG